jgi:hypothetical protein
MELLRSLQEVQRVAHRKMHGYSTTLPRRFLSTANRFINHGLQNHRPGRHRSDPSRNPLPTYPAPLVPHLSLKEDETRFSPHPLSLSGGWQAGAIKSDLDDEELKRNHATGRGRVVEIDPQAPSPSECERVTEKEEGRRRKAGGGRLSSGAE